MKMAWVALSLRMLLQPCAKDMHRFHACMLLLQRNRLIYAYTSVCMY